MSTNTGWQSNPYIAVLSSGPIALFWGGFTLSALGDAMTRVALIWYVFATTRSPQAVGALLLCYTGPVLVGGLIAGTLLDRFDRVGVMVIDNIVRGVAIGVIPLLHALGHLALWHLYVVAGVYGFFYMITLAGTPALIPSLMADEHLAAGNALEMLCYTISGVLGPPIAGVLITISGAPAVLLLDAASYAVFVLALLGVASRANTLTPSESRPTTGSPAPRPYRLRDAVQLLLGNQVLLSTTLMFIAFNVGTGFMAVWLPIFVDSAPGGNAALYGILLGVWAIGEVLGAALGGSVARTAALGALICLAQALSGLALLLVLLGGAVGYPLWGMGTALLLFGVCSAPLTIWAQTLRMRIIPAALRGRTFALLRTLMQGAGPLASAVGGLVLPVVGVPALIAASAAVVGGPGLVGMRVKALRLAAAGTMADTSSP